MERTRTTKLERSWIAYDIGNSAFTLLITTLVPLYFNALAKDSGLAPHEYLAFWGYGQSATTLIVVFLGPILGAWADGSRKKKQIFLGSVIIGILIMAAWALPASWLTFLIFFVIARVAYQASLIFYDAMLVDITTEERMDTISSYGFALGYIGSCLPFILSLLAILMRDKIGISLKQSMIIAIIVNAVWWLIFTLPLAKDYRQPSYISSSDVKVTNVFLRLWQTLKMVARDKKILLFLLAFFFYIDGVSTIISMSVSYGDSIGLGATTLLIALLVTQIVAFPFAILFGYLAKKVSNAVLIKICIVGYFLITLFAVQLDKNWEFFFLAICVGIFQGGIQALSRSYFARLIPKDRSSEYFALYDIFAKGAAFTGTTVMGVVSQVTGRQQLGILAIAVFFISGYILFRLSVKTPHSPQIQPEVRVD